MLADITLSVWAAERADCKIMDGVKAAAGTVGDVGRAIKNLLAGADAELRDVRFGLRLGSATLRSAPSRCPVVSGPVD